jgi:hypothetical protein
MARNAPAIQPDDLYARFGTANAPLLIDVQRETFEADDRLVIGATRRNPKDVDDWRQKMPSGHAALYRWCRLQAEKQRPLRRLASEKSA